MKEYAQRLTDLVEQYLPPDPEKLRMELRTAELGKAGNGISVNLKNYVKTGDLFALTLDPKTRKPQKIVIDTLLDRDPILVSADFSVAPNGASYPSLMKIESKKKDLEIRISAFDLAPVTR
jgi:hypothetical protein